VHPGMLALVQRWLAGETACPTKPGRSLSLKRRATRKSPA
jgi:hypothetical protein